MKEKTKYWSLSIKLVHWSPLVRNNLMPMMQKAVSSCTNFKHIFYHCSRRGDCFAGFLESSPFRWRIKQPLALTPFHPSSEPDTRRWVFNSYFCNSTPVKSLFIYSEDLNSSDLEKFLKHFPSFEVNFSPLFRDFALPPFFNFFRRKIR